MPNIARIYRPAKTAMQSGQGKSKSWVLEYDATDAQLVDTLMGWSGSADTSRQVRMSFEDKDDAVAFAKKHNIPFIVKKAQERKLQLKSYADNFRFDRVR